MKIAFLTDAISRNAGGVFDAVRRLVQSVAEANKEVRVFGVSDNHSVEDVRSWQPVSVETNPCRGPRSFGYAPGLNKSIEAFDPDVIHPQGLWKYSSVASREWSRRTHRPYIIHPHGMLDPWAVENSRWKKRIAGALYENAHLHGATCIRALCESEAQSIRAYGLRNPICVIPNGIDLPEPRAIPNDAFRMANVNGRKVLLYLGRLHPKKNLGPLIEAWAAVQRDGRAGPEWVLVIAGWNQGGYQRELEVQSSEFGVQSSVLFVGPRFGDDKAACYAKCDAFILPSLSEGLPMVVLEAWAYARPVLMTNECNLPEGFTANAAIRIGKETNSIAEGVRQMMAMSDSQRAAMGARGRALAAERFSWNDIGAEMLRVCDWAVNGGAAPASVRFD